MVSEATALVKNHIKDRRSYIDAELRKGTGSEHEFGVESAKLLWQAVSQLQALDDDYPAETDATHLVRRIEAEVEAFHKHLLLERGCSFDGVHNRLRKLQAWSEGFEQFRSFYTLTLDHIARIIGCTITDATAFDVAGLEAAPKEELACYICNLGVLKSVSDSSEQLASHNLDMESVIEAQHAARRGILSTLAAWSKEALAEMEAADLKERILQVFVVRAGVVDILHRLLEDTVVCSELRQETSALRAHFAVGASECVARVHTTQLKKRSSSGVASCDVYTATTVTRVYIYEALLVIVCSSFTLITRVPTTLQPDY